jgi:pimeloyl-ACP methyl ester carboxylesterase
VVAGAGHLMASTHPAAVAEIMVDFLRRHRRSEPR